ncbi:phage terminase large subunit [Brachyspira hyodysenteriae]|nr:phage terminase large subunit [Brachyspira hyodysenteriae]MCZ9889791.1 phage terminase large subunit [Brachyspira hyodysenteriae]MCZ9939402.1 phage terminase large subunit [Brachyspira hyodysenteriae]MDA0055035.1 phage terminase large subunit [Brachyspira hyodysenteriae]
MNIKFNILKPFEKWANTEKRLKIAFGGRGGGKSESIARILIAKSFEKSGVILCSRKYKNQLVIQPTLF